VVLGKMDYSSDKFSKSNPALLRFAPGIEKLIGG
jgi:hypothetical protein